MAIMWVTLSAVVDTLSYWVIPRGVMVVRLGVIMVYRVILLVSVRVRVL